MKRWIIVIVAVFLLAISRLVLTTWNKVDNEMDSYVHGLQYRFTATVDSVMIRHNKGDTGFLMCRLTSGTCNSNVEDSLNQHLTNYKRIRFLHFKTNDRFFIFLGGISKYQPMDSIVVNSSEDRFHVFRNQQVILESNVSRATTQKVSFAFWLND